jgi:hypothetical protein
MNKPTPEQHQMNDVDRRILRKHFRELTDDALIDVFLLLIWEIKARWNLR